MSELCCIIFHVSKIFPFYRSQLSVAHLICHSDWFRSSFYNSMHLFLFVKCSFWIYMHHFLFFWDHMFGSLFHFVLMELCKFVQPVFLITVLDRLPGQIILKTIVRIVGKSWIFRMIRERCTYSILFTPIFLDLWELIYLTQMIAMSIWFIVVTMSTIFSLYYGIPCGIFLLWWLLWGSIVHA